MKPKTIRDFLLTIEDEKIRTEAIEKATELDIIDREAFDLEYSINMIESCLDLEDSFAIEYWANVWASVYNGTLKTRTIE